MLLLCLTVLSHCTSLHKYVSLSSYGATDETLRAYCFALRQLSSWSRKARARLPSSVVPELSCFFEAQENRGTEVTLPRDVASGQCPSPSTTTNSVSRNRGNSVILVCSRGDESRRMLMWATRKFVHSSIANCNCNYSTYLRNNFVTALGIHTYIHTAAAQFNNALMFCGTVCRSFAVYIDIHSAMQFILHSFQSRIYFCNYRRNYRNNSL